MADSIFWINCILALALVAVPVTGLFHRNKVQKGIGWQFIRFCVIAMALPLVGLLALNGALSEGAIAIISGAMGFAFGKKEA